MGKAVGKARDVRSFFTEKEIAAAKKELRDDKGFQKDLANLGKTRTGVYFTFATASLSQL